MNIQEIFIKGKQLDDAGCEDGYFISNDYVGVVDGATSRGKYLWNNKKSGEYAKDVILSTISGCERELSCEQFFRRINKALQKEYAMSAIPLSERLRASLVVYSDFHKEIWVLGDCQCKINGELKDTAKKVDTCIAEVRSMLIQSFLKEGMTERELLDHDLSRQMIEPLIDRQFYLENQKSEFGYPVMNGYVSNYDSILRFKVEKGDMVILASDGYPILEDTLAKSEQTLEYLLKEDPLCYKIVKSTKGIENGQCSFDDRCFVRFEVD